MAFVVAAVADGRRLVVAGCIVVSSHIEAAAVEDKKTVELAQVCMPVELV